jgi:CRP/FNR family cyclic AMP-dependent transcriptional regulator
MGTSKRAPTLKPAGVLDWTGVRTQRVEYGPAAMIFAQGDPATSVMYVEQGAVRLSVVSHAGKEAVVVLVNPDLIDTLGVVLPPSIPTPKRVVRLPCVAGAVVP